MSNVSWRDYWQMSSITSRVVEIEVQSNRRLARIKYEYFIKIAAVISHVKRFGWRAYRCIMLILKLKYVAPQIQFVKEDRNSNSNAI